MNTKPFANLSATDPRTVAQQQLAELTDWQRRLVVADFEFNDDQRAVIEKLFSPVDRVELDQLIRAAWYAAARRAIPAAIKERRKLLGIAETPPKETDENLAESN